MSGSKDAEKERDLIRALLERYRVTSGDGFDLARHPTDDLPEDGPDKHEAKAILQQSTKRLAALQELLYANATCSVLVVIQAMDAGGKDSTIKHVMTGINPQGVVVTSFKAPGPHELAHDFLWRVHKAMPARGMIGIFNRSHYEEVLITRVHPKLLDAARMPPGLVEADDFWANRIADIAAFEAYLARQGTLVLKFFLNVGRDEQKRRFLDRLDDPDKTWKFSHADIAEREHRDAYSRAYQAAIAGTATKTAPWYVVPADRKWFTHLVVAEAIIAALDGLALDRPTLSEQERAELDGARRALEAD